MIVFQVLLMVKDTYLNAYNKECTNSKCKLYQNASYTKISDQVLHETTLSPTKYTLQNILSIVIECLLW